MPKTRIRNTSRKPTIVLGDNSPVPITIHVTASEVHEITAPTGSADLVVEKILARVSFAFHSRQLNSPQS